MRVMAGMRLEARDLEALFNAFIRAMHHLPPDTVVGYLDSEGELRLAPDLGLKLRTAACVRETLAEIRRSQAENTDG
jgi:hypothetical protein